MYGTTVQESNRQNEVVIAGLKQLKEDQYKTLLLLVNPGGGV